MSVVPVRSHLVGTEPVDELLAGRHHILGHARRSVLPAGDVVAVPVHGHTVVDVGVAERDLDQIARGGGDRRTGYLAAVRPSLDLPPGGEPYGGGLRGQYVTADSAAEVGPRAAPQIGY